MVLTNEISKTAIYNSGATQIEAIADLDIPIDLILYFKLLQNYFQVLKSRYKEVIRNGKLIFVTLSNIIHQVTR